MEETISLSAGLTEITETERARVPHAPTRNTTATPAHVSFIFFIRCIAEYCMRIHAASATQLIPIYVYICGEWNPRPFGKRQKSQNLDLISR